VKTRYCCSREPGSGGETGGLSLSKSGAPRELNDEWGKERHGEKWTEWTW
jgi:hypothetical protein